MASCRRPRLLQDVGAAQTAIEPQQGIQVARRELLSISGISKAGNLADVEFIWRWASINQVGAALYDGGVHYRATVGFHSYDDGWRVVDQKVPSNQTLEEALQNAQPTAP